MFVWPLQLVHAGMRHRHEGAEHQRWWAGVTPLWNPLVVFVCRFLFVSHCWCGVFFDAHIEDMRSVRSWMEKTAACVNDAGAESPGGGIPVVSITENHTTMTSVTVTVASHIS